MCVSMSRRYKANCCWKSLGGAGNG